MGNCLLIQTTRFPQNIFFLLAYSLLLCFSRSCCVAKDDCVRRKTVYRKQTSRRVQQPLREPLPWSIFPYRPPFSFYWKLYDTGRYWMKDWHASVTRIKSSQVYENPDEAAMSQHHCLPIMSCPFITAFISARGTRGGVTWSPGCTQS